MQLANSPRENQHELGTLKTTLNKGALLQALLTHLPYMLAFDSLHNQGKHRNLNVVSGQLQKYMTAYTVMNCCSNT